MITQKALNIISKRRNDFQLIDKYVVSAFIDINDIVVSKNKHILSHLEIEEHEKEYQKFLSELKTSSSNYSLDDVIETFEFLIPRKHGSMHGVVYTPPDIRKYIVSQSLKRLKNISREIKIADISCGAGGFLLNIAHYLKTKTKQRFSKIFRNNIYGLDLTPYSIERTKILLSLLALSVGEDEKEFNFNLFVGNALCFDWFSKCNSINKANGFDTIVGNPPYVRAKNLSSGTKSLMKKWSVTKTGNPDLYIPFFEVGLRYLKPNGVLGYITVNTFKRSVNARSLRFFFRERQLDLEIIDFGNSQVFRDKSTYTCIVFGSKRKRNSIKYAKILPENLNTKVELSSIEYSSLDCHKGWMLNTPRILENIKKLETIGSPLGEKYIIKNGLATLCNDIFIFKPIDSDNKFYYLKNGRGTHRIERKICRDIIKPNKLKTEQEIPKLLEKIVFPYHYLKDSLGHFSPKTKNITLFEEGFFKNHYPNAYYYLSENKQKLLNRDKGKGKLKYKWYEYGRTQALTDYGLKLLFPYMSDRPYFVLSTKKDMLIYAGYAIFSKNREELTLLKKILISDVFWYYIKNTSKPYASDYFALAKNYVKDFSICHLSIKEQKYLTNTDDAHLINNFLSKKYRLVL